MKTITGIYKLPDGTLAKNELVIFVLSRPDGDATSVYVPEVVSIRTDNNGAASISLTPNYAQGSYYTCTVAGKTIGTFKVPTTGSSFNVWSLIQAYGLQPETSSYDALVTQLSSQISDGREVQLQKSATHVQWRYTGETTWQNLIALSELVGPQGLQGVEGLQGPAGQGVPVGGSAGQVLAKIDNTNFNTQWVNQTGGAVDLGDRNFLDIPLNKLTAVKLRTGGSSTPNLTEENSNPTLEGTADGVEYGAVTEYASAVDRTTYFSATIKPKTLGANNPSVGIALVKSNGDFLAFYARQNGQLFNVLQVGAGITTATNLAANTNFDYVVGENITVELSHNPVTGVVKGKVRVGSSVDSYTLPSFVGEAKFALSVRGLTRAEFERVWTDTLPDLPAQGVSSASTMLFVSTTGSDAAAGDVAAPLATINAALTKLNGVGTVLLRGGDYRQQINISLIKDIKLQAYDDETVRILGSAKLTVTKTAGRTQVYQASLTNKPTGQLATNARIFDDSTPSKPIAIADRHPLDRGRTHRLPFTELFELTGQADLNAALATLDTPSGEGKWYHSSGVIYFALAGGADATTRNIEAQVQTICSNFTFVGDLEIQNISFMYSSGDGFSSVGAGSPQYGLRSVKRVGCRALGNRFSGFIDNAFFTESHFDEAAANGNDGANGHGSTSGSHVTAVYHGVYNEFWGHDNFDEGHSWHERGMVDINGGLFEYNGSIDCGGIGAAQGVDYVIEGAVMRYNTYAGIGTVNASSDGGREVSVVMRGCLSYGNGTSNYKNTLANAKMELVDCVSRDAGTGYGYEGTITAIDCKHGGAGVAKSPSGVTVITNTALS